MCWPWPWTRWRPWEQRLREAGIPVDDRTESTLFVSDPDGHRVGLSVYAIPFAP